MLPIPTMNVLHVREYVFKPKLEHGIHKVIVRIAQWTSAAPLETADNGHVLQVGHAGRKGTTFQFASMAQLCIEWFI